MPDTRWILPALEKLRQYPAKIPAYPIAWVAVNHKTKEITLIGFKAKK